jgi:transporter family-2 protein
MSWQTTLLFAVPLVAGALIPIQTGANRMVATGLHSPLLGAGVSMGLAALVLIGASLSQLRSGHVTAALATLPGWAWTGGLLGAVFVTGAIVIAPRIGATSYLMLVFVGQMLMATATDHFGLFGFAERPIGPVQLAGVVATLCSATVALGQLRL